MTDMIRSKLMHHLRGTHSLNLVWSKIRGISPITTLWKKVVTHRNASNYGSQKAHSENATNSSWSGWVLGISFTSLAIVTGYNKRGNFITKVHAAEPRDEKSSAGKSLRETYNFIANVVEDVSPAVVFIQNSSQWRPSSGSGFIISTDGLIVTNAHVVQSSGKRGIEVHLPNGKKYAAEVLVIDTTGDLALIKIEETNLPTIRLAPPGSLRHGEFVVAVGSPLSLSNTVTSGIISSTGRTIANPGVRRDINYIQTDAAITFGNSGGPLINLDGEAVGVNAMKITEGISFAIPSDYVQKFLERANDFRKQHVQQKKWRPPYVGIVTLTLSPQMSALLRDRSDIKQLDVDAGVFVVDVDSGSPAQEAGIEKYDVIIKVDDEVTKGYEDLVNAIRDKTTVKCIVYRQGSMMEINIRPKQPSNSEL